MAGPGGVADVLVSINTPGHSVHISRGSLRTLQPGVNIDDTIIDATLGSLGPALRTQSANGGPRVAILSSFFFTKLTEDGGTARYDKVKTWRCNPFDHDIILVPIHRPGHWTLAVIDLRDQTMRHHDSLQKDDLRTLPGLMVWLRGESMRRRKAPLPE